MVNSTSRLLASMHWEIDMVSPSETDPTQLNFAMLCTSLLVVLMFATIDLTITTISAKLGSGAEVSERTIRQFFAITAGYYFVVLTTINFTMYGGLLTPPELGPTPPIFLP